MGTNPADINRLGYFEDSSHALPAKLLRHFERNIKKDLHNILAVDIGVGAGSDSRKLLMQGAKVFAIDGDEASREYVYKNIPEELLANLSWQQQKLEDLHLPKNQLTFSAKTLGFVQPKKFDSMMERIKNSIDHEGYFVGNFFGDECDANIKIMKFNAQQVLNLFYDFKVLYLEERRGEKYDNNRKQQEHRHFVDIIAQKR